MYTVTVLAQKGGTGKTTIVINLAVAAEASGLRVALLDLDPQASAAGWGDQPRQHRPAVAAVPASRLAGALATAVRSHGADLALIDTAPHSESTALAAARVADLALIPLRPGVLDLRALGTTADICQLARVPDGGRAEPGSAARAPAGPSGGCDRGVRARGGAVPRGGAGGVPALGHARAGCARARAVGQGRRRDPRAVGWARGRLDG